MGRNNSELHKEIKKVVGMPSTPEPRGNHSGFPTRGSPPSTGGFGHTHNFFLTLIVPLLLIGCKEKINIKEGRHGEEAAQRIEGVKAQIRDGGQVKWQLASPEAEIFEGQNSLAVSHPYIKVYSANELSSTLSSGAGNVNLDTMDMELYNGAVAISTTGAKVSGEQFAYMSNKNLIISTTPVQIIRNGSITTGSGLEATPDLSHITIKSQRLELEHTQLNHTPK